MKLNLKVIPLARRKGSWRRSRAMPPRVNPRAAVTMGGYILGLKNRTQAIMEMLSRQGATAGAKKWRCELRIPMAKATRPMKKR